MNTEVESKIISSFIIDRKKDRAKYELSNHKKRESFIWKVGNNDYLNEQYAQKITQPVLSFEDIHKILKKNGAPDNCYMLGIGDFIDGKTVSLYEALKEVVFKGPALISCIHGKLAYIEGEVTAGPGPAERYLLVKK